jgi:agmatinase
MLASDGKPVRWVRSWEGTVAEQDRFGVRDLGAPWYAGSPSFMRSRWVEPSEVPDGYVAVVGMPIDAWNLARGGTRWGPRAMREASLYPSMMWGIQPDTGYISSRTGQLTTWPSELRLVDTGDVVIRPADEAAQTEGAMQHIAAASLTSQLTLTLGGDHYVSYPAFAGVMQSWRERKSGIKAGYLHIDSHADFFDQTAMLGRYNHSTCARRVSEIPEVTRMAWFGINGETSLEPNQFQVMRDRGFQVCTSYYSHNVGMRESMEQLVDYLTDGVNLLYVSVDIDVVTGAHAPSTHTPTFESLSAIEFLDALRVLSSVDNLVGADMCEVAPTIDPSQRTERLALAGLLAMVGHRILDVGEQYPDDELRRVFIGWGS